MVSSVSMSHSSSFFFVMKPCRWADTNTLAYPKVSQCTKWRRAGCLLICIEYLTLSSLLDINVLLTTIVLHSLSLSSNLEVVRVVRRFFWVRCINLLLCLLPSLPNISFLVPPLLLPFARGSICHCVPFVVPRCLPESASHGQRPPHKSTWSAKKGKKNMAISIAYFQSRVVTC
ncbi:hypothetical protein B0H15DRAFT_174991 [Mycena belliarum]|uniref:Uncharacterized protein n=1 Tax=Mycena belliarum TaxID=1033014 RepID=A0AAD6U778_9AGAR|nr:hypothetical protein B0H15DRAFT_174991 [Mycena belliae]